MLSYVEREHCMIGQVWVKICPKSRTADGLRLF